uniref:Uncharacterized protein n=1 Tax=Vannella robusta TaxID=1487602 RepID=A0A6U1T6I5_9EUKA
METMEAECYEAGFPLSNQFRSTGGLYDDHAFALGFFAAINVVSDDVEIDLNGFKLQQAAEHRLQQKFFSLIELGNMPFVPREGPLPFGDKFQSVSNIVIKNGVLGNNAHHGIHGNFPTNVTVDNVDIFGYEIAGIALNGASCVTIKNVRLLGTATDVPVLASYLGSRLISKYVDYLVDNGYSDTLSFGETVLNAQEVQNALRAAITEAFHDVVHDDEYLDSINPEHEEAFAVLHNKKRLADGSSYGILLNKAGTSVFEFPEVSEDNAEGVYLINVEVRDHFAGLNEIVHTTYMGEPVSDPNGVAFQILNKHPYSGEYVTISSDDWSTATYVGNFLANAQALVGKAVLSGFFDGTPLETSKTKFNMQPEVISWIENGGTVAEYIELFPLMCSSDAQAHVPKGAIGIKLDGSAQITAKGVKIHNVRNFADLGVLDCGYTTEETMHPQAFFPGYVANSARGMSISGSVHVKVEDLVIDGVTSDTGSAYGLDIMRDSRNILVMNAFVDYVLGAPSLSEEDFQGPNHVGEAVGFNINNQASSITLKQISCGEHLQAAGEVEHLRDNSLQI